MRFAKFLCFALLAAAMLAIPAPSQAQVAVGISVHIGPPALPVYPQPICPGPGYIWTPGYWAYGPDGYFWVPGTWVVAPAVGLLWTPGYWGWSEGVFIWHGGYWGPHVGFYGGINYGYGYGGVGFVGGEWRGGVFAYNRSVTNVNVTEVHNTYINNTVVNKTTVVNNVSYNGGTGGTTAQPTAGERAAERDHHVEATHEQMQHEHAASTDRAQLASVNHGRPAVAASAKAGVLRGKGVMAARTAGNANRPSSGNNGSGNRPGGNENAAARNNRNDRPPSAINRSASTAKGDTAPMERRNSSRPPQNGSRMNTSSREPNGNRSPSAQRAGGPRGNRNAPHGNASAPRGNEKPERGRERP